MNNQKHNDMLAFLPVNWPPCIRQLSFKQVLVLLPQEIVGYLKSDQVFVSEDYRDNKNLGRDNTSGDDCPRFPCLETLFSKYIEEYEGVFVKLNWRAPRDCCNWLLDLKCLNLYDVLLALKTSGIIMETLTDYEDWLVSDSSEIGAVERKDPAPQPMSNGYYLTLRKWYPINLQREYRCFIRNKRLIGISQRNLSTISSIVNRDALLHRIEQFYQERVSNNFVDTFVMDIYIDIPPKERIILVDMNPWGEYTQPKLFTWEELENCELQLRTVDSEEEISQEDMSHYRMPSDFTDIQDPSQIIELIQQMCQ